MFRLAFSERGLQRVGFPKFPKGPIKFEGAAKGVETAFPDGISSDWIALAISAIRSGIRGRAALDLPPLDLQGTAFQRRVWDALLTIPCGSTRTYGDIAVQIGSPGAVRAVGRACGANPIPIIVPCHRVLAANKKIGGFSGGEGWKPFLLRQEGWGAGVDLPLFQARENGD